jgi:TnpA family transposase
MQSWQSTFLGIRALPRDLSEFELQAFFTFGADERRLIETRRSDAHQLGLALHIGFIRLSGQLLDAKRIAPASLWRHLGTELGVANPEIASLKAMYRRARTLLEHQQMACNYLGVKRMREHQRRALVRVLRDEVQRSGDSDQLLVFARTWLYRHKLLIPHARALRAIVAAALVAFESATNQSIAEAVPSDLLNRWRAVLTAARSDGQTTQSWLWAAPAKHSTRQMTELFERIEALYALDVQMHLRDVSDWTLTRFARRLAGRSPSVSARIKARSRTVEVACFLRYCLLSATDRLLLMVQRRISDIARSAASAVTESVSWAALYKQLLAELSALAHAPMHLPAPDNDTELRAQLCALLAAQAKHKPATRAARIREQLLDTAAPSVRTLLAAMVRLPWSAEGDAHPVRVAVRELSAYYANRERFLPQGAVLPELGAAWRSSIMGEDRQRALIAFEMATVFALRRALRNGSIWIEHSLSFKGRARLFFAPDRWTKESGAHYSRLSLPRDPGKFLEPLIAKVHMGAETVAAAVRQGVLRIDDELHIGETDTEEESPEITALRDKLDARIGSVQLPEVILAVDAQVRFSWLMLGREPRSADELLMVYAGIMAHGTSLSAAECSRMIPQLSASSIRQAMRWAADERRLTQASQAVLEFMHRHPIAQSWGRADLASSDMMSMETTKRVWQARMDPRRNTPSVGIYSHVRDRWGVFYAQPFVLNERQAGVAIEGVVRNERIVTRQLAVDTHGYTDFAMTLSRLLGFDLCPRLKELKQRHLYLPRGMSVPVEIGAACRAEINPQLIVDQWDRLVNLAAAVSSGHASAVATLARFGSAATGDPVYDAGVQLGKLLRTSFLSDYFTNPSFRHELRRVLNRGEAVNAMKRSIYTGRIAPAQAKRAEEMQAVADALNLLANIVMAWNTMQLQAVLGRWANRRQFIAPELTGKVAPTRLEGINLRGIFRFPTERYAEQLLPSRPIEKTPRAA